MHKFLHEIASVKNIDNAFLTLCQTHPQYLYGPNTGKTRENLLHRRHFANQLANQLKKQKFSFSAAKVITIKPQPDKERLVHLFPINDQLVMRLMAQACIPYLMKTLSANVFSYLPARHHLQAIQKLSVYLKKTRDIYLLRTDVTHYTDSILVNKSAPLWDLLAKFLASMDSKNPVPEYVLQLFQQALRPIITTDNEQYYQQWQGIALGTPLTPIIANLYLNSLDHLIESNGIQLYLRFGDDIILADTSRQRLLDCNKLLSNKLKELSLIRQPDKDQYFFLNRAGFKDKTTLPFIGSACFEYLGSKIFANGNVALPVMKQRKFLTELYQRINQLNKILINRDIRTKGKILCRSISIALTQSTIGCCYQNIVTQVVNNRQQLRQLDYLIAKKIAEKLTGTLGCKAFREVPYKQLRQWGLVSLCQLRNNVKVKFDNDVQ